MSKINIVMADSEKQYIEKLCEYIIEKYSVKYNIYYFTDIDLLTEFLKNEGQTIDIWILGSEIYNKVEVDNGIKVLFSLDSEKQYHYTDYVIYKYQNIDTILEKAENIITNNSSIPLKNYDSKNCEIISFYSPIGGSGKSSISINVAVFLAQQGKRVLYICLDDYDWMSDNSRSMSALLYGLKRQSDNIETRIEDSIIKDELLNVDILASFESVSELEELRAEEMQLLLSQLLKMNKYDYVLLDLSVSFTKRNILCLEKSSKVFLIHTPGEIERRKTDRFKEEIILFDGFEDKEITDVFNKSNTYYDDSDIFINYVESVPTPYDYAKGLNTVSEYNEGIMKIAGRIFR